MKNFLVLVLITFVCFSCKDSSTLTEVAKRDSQLIDVFKASNFGYPNISVHRGGKGLLNYPENCLETLQYVNDSIFAIYEVDVAQTKDGELVLMHDNAIERTTTGNGLVKDITYDELNSYHLVDDFGNITAFKVPLFSEVLTWCETNNVILTVDIKRSVRQDVVINAIKDAKAEDVAIIITRDVAQAISAYKTAPELLLSVSARSHIEIDRLFDTKIPIKNMLAFTGTRLSDPSLYDRLHDANIVCILGTLGNLDKQADSKGNQLYTLWKNIGVDIMATDRPFEAFKAIN